MAQVDGATTEDSIFQAQWELYQNVLAGDYLEHSKLYSQLVDYLRRHLKGGWSLLDLGCGDAFYMAKLLKESQLGQSLQAYVGVDMSRAALAFADQLLREALPQDAQVELVESEMLQYTQQCTKRFDVVVSSFAVHHLTMENKQRLVEQVAKLLKPGGCFLLADVFLAEGQSREAYMDEYLEHVERDWLRLTPGQRHHVKQHVSSFDFPASLSDYQRWATAAEAAEAAGSKAGQCAPAAGPAAPFCSVQVLCEARHGKLVVLATAAPPS